MGLRLRFTVPGVPPSVNHMYRRFTYKGRRMQVVTRSAETWMQGARLAALTATARDGWTVAPKGQQVIVRLWYYWPDRIRRDTHNTLKAILDSWEGVIYEDDKDALPRIMAAEVDRESPRIEVEVEVA